MKLIIIRNKENNQIKETRLSNYKSYNNNFERPPKRTGQVHDFYRELPKLTMTYKSKKTSYSLPSFNNIVKSIKSIFSFGNKDTKKEIIEKRIETYKEKEDKKVIEISEEYKMNIKE